MSATESHPMPGVEEAEPRESVASSGRIRVEGLTNVQRHFSVAMHLSPFAVLIASPVAFLIPLILWLIRKDESGFEDDHGREVVNFLISYFLLGLLFVWTVAVPVILLIVGMINMVRGAIAASNGEYFRYPMTIRFLS